MPLEDRRPEDRSGARGRAARARSIRSRTRWHCARIRQRPRVRHKAVRVGGTAMRARPGVHHAIHARAERMIERFFGTLKSKCASQHRDRRSSRITRWIDRQRTDRPDSALGYLTPAELREHLAAEAVRKLRGTTHDRRRSPHRSGHRSTKVRHWTCLNEVGTTSTDGGDASRARPLRPSARNRRS